MRKRESPYPAVGLIDLLGGAVFEPTEEWRSRKAKDAKQATLVLPSEWQRRT